MNRQGTERGRLQPAAHRHARFLSGSIPRHVLAMTLMGAIGLMSMFAVDLADLWFISMLGRVETTAGIGFAGILAFINISVALGGGIAAGALVAVNLGRGRRIRARKFATSSLLVAATTGLVLSVFAQTLTTPILSLLGASGSALEEAAIYLRIVAIGFPLIASAIIFSFSLRAIGDARRAMYVTLVTAITNAILDPVFIFALDMGIAGAATATVMANLLSLLVGWHGLSRIHGMLGRPSLPQLRRDTADIARIAIPATLTQLATPFLVAYILFASARFGDEVVAASTIVNRLAPVFFGIVFSLSGAVGPIIGQNFGAGHMERVQQTFIAGILLATGYTLVMAGILFVFREDVPRWFSVGGETARLVTFFSTWLTWSWIFTGGQFVAQAAFNNLGKARWSTAFNWARATIGTIVPVEIMSAFWGAWGLFAGSAIGSSLVGLAATWTAWRLIGSLARNT